MLNNQNIKKILILLLIAILSTTLVSKIATSEKTHHKTAEVLNEKKNTALALTGSVAVTSTVLAAVPGDSTTAISNQISELSTPLFIVVCSIYLQKFLLTTMGYISFSLVIPLACVLWGIYIFNKKDVLAKLAIKLIVFAFAIYMVIPVSVKVIGFIESTFETSISETLESAEKVSEKAEEIKGENESNFFTDTVSKITGKMQSFAEDAKNSLEIFVDAIAVMIITTCVIPVAVIFFFVYILKILFGINIDVDKIKQFKFSKKPADFINSKEE